MKLTFLGTGTSQGVPIIGCRCAVCCSEDSRDKRLRTAAMVEVQGLRLIIDAGPDFRYQMLREGLRHIDAILLTHGHKDHIGGLDDVRAFNFVDYPTIHRIPIYGADYTLEAVRHDFAYAFVVGRPRYRGVPELELVEVDTSRPFRVGGVEVVPIAGHHSSRFQVTGYRIGGLAYLTDFKTIEPCEVEKLRGLDTLVVNALRRAPHDSHFSLDEALALIEEVKPRRAYLTHQSHDMGRYVELERDLPEGVFSAYDRLKIEIPEQYETI